MVCKGIFGRAQISPPRRAAEIRARGLRDPAVAVESLRPPDGLRADNICP